MMHVYSQASQLLANTRLLRCHAMKHNYANVQLHKAEEVHIYEDMHSAAQSQRTVITTRNEAYASWITPSTV